MTKRDVQSEPESVESTVEEVMTILSGRVPERWQQQIEAEHALRQALIRFLNDDASGYEVRRIGEYVKTTLAPEDFPEVEYLTKALDSAI